VQGGGGCSKEKGGKNRIKGGKSIAYSILNKKQKRGRGGATALDECGGKHELGELRNLQRVES